MYPFGRSTDGRLQVVLYDGQQTLLHMLLTEVRTLVASSDPENRASDRLFPTAYLDPTETAAEAEWQSTVHDDLVREKLAAFDEVRALLSASVPEPDGILRLDLDADQEERLLGALNDTRLLLAELIDNAPADLDRRDTSATPGEHVVGTNELLEWLTALVSELVEVKLSELPEQGDA